MSNKDDEYPELSTVYPPPAATPPPPSEYPTLDEAFGPSSSGAPAKTDSSFFSGETKDVIAKIIAAASNAAPIVSGFAQGPLGAMDTNAAMQIPGLTNQVSQQAGSAVAEKAGELMPNSPNAAAALGTAVSMAPDIAAAAGGMGALEAGKEALPNAVRGLLTSPEELGPEFAAGEKAAGVSTETLPVRRGTIPKFPGLDGLPSNTPPPEAPTVAPSVYPKDTATFLNFARARVDGLGDQLQPQELADYRVILNNMIKGGEVKPGTKPYALANQLYTDTNSLFNDAISGREDLNQVYKYAKMMPNIGEFIGSAVKKYGPWVIKGTMAAAGAEGVWKAIEHLWPSE